MCNNPRYFPNIRDPFTGRLYPVPCHRCKGCVIDRITMWDRRLSFEYVNNPSTFFTLTYDDYHLPFNRGFVLPTFRLKDYQNFTHRLRYLVNQLYPNLKIKFASCSEYGEKKNRPHFHGICFGLSPKEFRGLFYEAWSCGLVDVGAVRKGGIRYIMKYMSKQIYGEQQLREYFDTGRESPSMYFSKGLGLGWFISQFDNIAKYGCAKVGSRFVPVPSYWKNKFFNFTLDNIESVRFRASEYARQMNSVAVNYGYDSYDSFLRSARKTLESVYEKKDLNFRGVKSSHLSWSIPDYRLNPFSELVTDYKSNKTVAFLFG